MAATVEYHFGPLATDPDPEAKVEVLTFKHEDGGTGGRATGPLFVGDWKIQSCRPYATVTWEDGTTSTAWMKLSQARALAKAMGARLVEF